MILIGQSWVNMKIKLEEISKDGKEVCEKEIYLDGILKNNLDLGMKQLRKDWDQVWFIDGKEGSGKSVLGVTCAYYVSSPERRSSLIDRIVVKIEDAPQVIKDAQPFDSVVLDESYGAMASSGHMVKLNRMLQRLFTEIRAKNLFIFIVSPTFMDINRYFAIWRSKCLLHVYSDKGLRGYCSFFNEERKKRLFILGRKQFYNYNVVKPNFRFRFTNSSRNVIDWEEYKRIKKEKNLEIEQEPDVANPKIMIELYMRIINNIDKTTKPLTLPQRSELLAISYQQIRYYKDLLESKRSAVGGNNNVILYEDEKEKSSKKSVPVSNIIRARD